jgi:hypothetical protein
MIFSSALQTHDCGRFVQAIGPCEKYAVVLTGIVEVVRCVI